MKASCYCVMALTLLVTAMAASPVFEEPCTYTFDNGTSVDMSALMEKGMDIKTDIKGFTIGLYAGVCNRSASRCSSDLDLITGSVLIKCYALASGKWTDTTVSLEDSGVLIAYPQGDIEGIKISLKILMQCDPSIETYKYINIDPLHLTIIMTSKHACARLAPTNFERFLTDAKAKYILGPLAIIIGIPLVVVAVKLYSLALFVMTALLICVALACGIYAIPVHIASWIGYPIIIIAMVVGLGASYVIRKKAAFLHKFFAGGVGGMVLALWFSVIFLAYLPVVNFYIVAPIVVVACGFLAKFKPILVFVVSSAMAGACLFMHGVGAFIGGYRHDIEFYRQHTANVSDPTDYFWTIYVYLAFTMVLAALGTVIQLKFEGKESEDAKSKREAFFEGKTSEETSLLDGLDTLTGKGAQWMG